MSGDSAPPSTHSINEDCPSPDIVAQKKIHFGHKAWEWKCPHAEEVTVAGKGIEVKCSVLNELCCIDDNKNYFVNSSKTEPLRNFFETTLNYFSIKNLSQVGKKTGKTD